MASQTRFTSSNTVEFSDVAEIDVAIKPSPSSSPSRAMASQDGDPRPPHYDPKINYQIASGERENHDSFVSEISSDAETAEETLSSGFLYCEEDRQPLVSKIEPETTQLKESPMSNSGSFIRWMIVPMVLVFAIACFFNPLILTPAQGLKQDIVSNEHVDILESGVQAPVNLFQVVGIVLATLIAAAGYVYARHNKATIPEIGYTCEKVIQRKLSARGDSEDRFPSRPTEVDMGSVSVPSEMSSSSGRSCTDGIRESDRVNEAYSHEKRLNYSDKALSSSSEDSYGSFTTYEKIPTKHGHGEDEVVTPVRRSSRIRKITSP